MFRLPGIGLASPTGAGQAHSFNASRAIGCDEVADTSTSLIRESMRYYD